MNNNVWILFSFSLTGCQTKDNRHTLPYYFSWIGGDNRWIHAFLKGINTRRNLTASYWIWTRVACFISYDGNYYPKLASCYVRMCTSVYVDNKGGVRGGMVIVVGNGHSDASSNLDKTVCISHCAKTLGRSMNSTIISSAIGK